jgi:hypothetical protein
MYKERMFHLSWLIQKPTPGNWNTTCYKNILSFGPEIKSVKDGRRLWHRKFKDFQIYKLKLQFTYKPIYYPVIEYHSTPQPTIKLQGYSKLQDRI